MFQSCLTEIISCFSGFVNLLFSLEIVSGVSIGSLIIAITLLNLTLNLLHPALSGASSGAREFDYSRGKTYEDEVNEALHQKGVQDEANSRWDDLWG